MVAGGVISGLVRDRDGQPLADITVRAFTLTYRDGMPALATIVEKGNG
jgi:hypothetical protein